MSNFFTKFKMFFVGFLFSSFIFIGVTVFADSGQWQKWNVFIPNIRVFMDEKVVILKDAKGNRVEPVQYNGTTYLPLRALAETIGKEVYWDKDTGDIYLGKNQFTASTVTSTSTPTITSNPTPVNDTPTPQPTTKPVARHIDTNTDYFLRDVYSWGNTMDRVKQVERVTPYGETSSFLNYKNVEFLGYDAELSFSFGDNGLKSIDYTIWYLKNKESIDKDYETIKNIFLKKYGTPRAEDDTSITWELYDSSLVSIYKSTSMIMIHRFLR